jgi:lysophospholipase L1-like esterase
VRKLNRTIEELAHRHEAVFLDLYGSLDPGDFTDGLHPNSSGHRKLFEVVRAEIERLGWDE